MYACLFFYRFKLFYLLITNSFSMFYILYSILYFLYFYYLRNFIETLKISKIIKICKYCKIYQNFWIFRLQIIRNDSNFISYPYVLYRLTNQNIWNFIIIYLIIIITIIWLWYEVFIFSYVQHLILYVFFKSLI